MTPILLFWVREGYGRWLEPETWMLRTARMSGDILARLVKHGKTWSCAFTDGSLATLAFETDLLHAQVKTCEFLEARAPGRYQWPIGEARQRNVKKRW